MADLPATTTAIPGPAIQPVSLPQNPYAAPGSDPNAALFAAYGSNIKATSPVVTTATPFQNHVDNLGNNITNAAGSPPVTPTPSNPTGIGTIGYDANTDPNVLANITQANQIYTDRQTALDAERDAAVKALQDEQTRKADALAQTQKGETATSSRNLAYLQQGGNSASAQAYLISLEQSHGKEMDNLNAQYTSAIQTAKNAYSDKDFALAEAMTKNASAIKESAQQRNSDFLSYTLKLRQQANDDLKIQMQQQQTLQDITNGARDYATKNGITQPFYELAGTLFNSGDGSIIENKDDYLAAGGAPDYSNVFVVKPNDNKSYAGGPLGEFQYLVDQGKYQPGDLLKYLAQKKQDAVDIAAAGRAPRAESAHDIALAEKAQATQAYNDMDAKLQARMGKKDNYISPQDWAYYRGLWTQAGNKAADFDSNFVHYANPGTKDNPLEKDYIGLQ